MCPNSSQPIAIRGGCWADEKYVQGLPSSKNAIGPRLFSVFCELPLKRPPASQRGSRSFGISCRSSRSARSASSRVTTTLGDARSHPRAVERGTPRSVAMVTSPVRRTRSLSRWSYCCCGRGVDGIRMMMGRSLTSLNCAKAPRDVARRDANSRTKIQNVDGASSVRVSLRWPSSSTRTRSSAS